MGALVRLFTFSGSLVPIDLIFIGFYSISKVQKQTIN